MRRHRDGGEGLANRAGLWNTSYELVRKGAGLLSGWQDHCQKKRKARFEQKMLRHKKTFIIRQDLGGKFTKNKFKGDIFYYGKFTTI